METTRIDGFPRREVDLQKIALNQA